MAINICKDDYNVGNNFQSLSQYQNLESLYDYQTFRMTWSGQRNLSAFLVLSHPSLDKDDVNDNFNGNLFHIRTMILTKLYLSNIILKGLIGSESI